MPRTARLEKSKRRWTQLRFALDEQICDETGNPEDIKKRVQACLKLHQWGTQEIKTVLGNLTRLVEIHYDEDEVPTAFVHPGSKAIAREIIPGLQ